MAVDRKIEQEIIDGLNEVSSDRIKSKKDWSTPKWTNCIKEKLKEIGEQKYLVCPREDSGQWLYDLMWYENDKRKGDFLKNAILVVESEWGNFEKIKYDFEKLLLCNCKLKLMICQTSQIGMDETYFDKAIHAYKTGNSGERFLIAILDDINTSKFTFKVIARK